MSNGLQQPVPGAAVLVGLRWPLTRVMVVCVETALESSDEHDLIGMFVEDVEV